MDPSNPDFFRQLNSMLQLPLIAVCSGLGAGLYCTGLLEFSKLLFKFVTLPQELMEFLAHLATLWFFTKQIQKSLPYLAALWIITKQIRNAKTLIGVMFPSQIAEQFEAEYQRPLPTSMKYILPGLRIVTFLASCWYFLGRYDVFLTPLRAFSTEPSWILLIPYAYLVLEFFQCAPDISTGYFSPVITALVRSLIVYPYETIIRRWKRLLSHTFIEGPVRGNKTFSSLPQFQYSLLEKKDEIRLLKLTPRGRRMSVQLKHRSIKGCPPYWAVSYKWGSNKPDHQIVIQANKSSYFLPITESCATALTLLTPLQTRYLWIDAICINQHSWNSEEKELQIPLMADIYSRAEQVVGCISTSVIPADVTPLTQSFLFNITRYIRSNPHDKAMQLPYLHPIFDWIGFCRLLEHEYWERAWIIQEMALAKKLIFIYEEASFSLDQYSYVVKNLFNRMATGKVTNQAAILKYVPHLFILLTRMGDRLDKLQELKTSISSADRSQWPALCQVADMQDSLMATDPRDQIYALLGLASDKAAPELKPDYSKSSSYETVVKKAMFHSFKSGQLHFFLGAGLAYRVKGSAEGDLPSWVPVFPRPVRRREGNWALDKIRKGIFHLDYLISKDETELSVQGAIADEVAILCPVSAIPRKLYEGQENKQLDEGRWSFPPDMLGPRDHMIQQGVKNLSDFFRATRQLADQYIATVYSDKISRTEAYHRAMIMNWDGAGNGGKSPASYRTLTTFAKFRSAYVSAFKGGSIKPTKEMYDQDFGTTFEKLFFSHWYNYDFAITRRRRMAWVPQGSRPGDALCFFNGIDGTAIDVPFSLRPVEGTGKYYLVGDAYIHGLMNVKAKELNVEATSVKII